MAEQGFSLDQVLGMKPASPTEPGRPGRPATPAADGYSLEQITGQPSPPSGWWEQALDTGRRAVQTIKGTIPGMESGISRVDQFLPSIANPLEGLGMTPGAARRNAGAAGQFVDALTGIAREVVGAPLYVGGRIAAQTQGASQREAAEFAKSFKEDTLDRIPGGRAIFAPFATIADSLGGEYKKAYEENPVATVFGWITKGIEKGAKVGEARGGVPAADLEEAAAMAMTALGGKGVQSGLRQASIERMARARVEATAAGQEAVQGVLRQADRRAAKRAAAGERLGEQQEAAYRGARSEKAQELVAARELERARMEQDASIPKAEVPPALRSALEKGGERPALTPEETAAMEQAAKDAGLVDEKGAPLKERGAADPRLLSYLALGTSLGVGALPGAAALMNWLDPDRRHTMRSILGLEEAKPKRQADEDRTPLKPVPHINEDEPGWSQWRVPYPDESMPLVPTTPQGGKAAPPKDTLVLNEGEVDKLREGGLWKYVAPALLAGTLGVKGAPEALRGVRASEAPAPPPPSKLAQLSKTAALYGTSAALGAYLSSDNRLTGAALGALGMRGFRYLQDSPRGKEAVGDYVGLTSTEVGKVAGEAMKRRLRDTEMDTMTKAGERLERVEGFARDLAPPLRDRVLGRERLSPADREALNTVLLDDEGVAGRKAILDRNPLVRAHYEEVRSVLDEITGEQKKLGRFKEGIPDYFPRVVKDYEGLKNALGEEVTKGLAKTLVEATKESRESRGRGLSEVEQSVIIDNWLKSQPPTSFPPGFIRNRSVHVTPELAQFYEAPAESLINYIGEATRDIETAKFFGRDLKSAVKEGRSFTDLTKSAGSLTQRLLDEGKIDDHGAARLKSLLEARFGKGESSSSPFFQHLMNTTNAALLGSGHSAATQIADLFMVPVHQDMVPTLKAVRQALTGDSTYTAKDFQLGNHIAAELGRSTWSGKLLHAVLAPIFKPVDMFAKKINLNASLEKNLTQLRKDPAAFERKWGEAFGEDLPALVRDLQAGDSSSPLVRSMVFTELSDVQPVSRSEMPPAWLQHPDGRILYQLKSFMLKQTDIIRRRAYDEISKGTPAGISAGTKALLALGTMYTLSNVPPDLVKDILSGRQVDLDKIDYMDAFLKNFGVSRYTLDKGAGKPFEQLLKTPADIVTPPILTMGKDLDQPERLMKYVPLVGRAVYDRELGGNEARERGKAMSESQRVSRESLQSLDPQERDLVKKWRRATKAEKEDMRHDPAVGRALRALREAREAWRPGG